LADENILSHLFCIGIKKIFKKHEHFHINDDKPRHIKNNYDSQNDQFQMLEKEKINKLIIVN